MSLLGTIGIATGAMQAQSLRLNLVASNLANAEVSAGSEAAAYHAQRPFFVAKQPEQQIGFGVKVQEVVSSKEPVRMKYDPADPLANEQGMVWKTNVDVAAEMADMISASRAYQLNAEVANMSRSLFNRALNIGQ